MASKNSNRSSKFLIRWSEETDDFSVRGKHDPEIRNLLNRLEPFLFWKPFAAFFYQVFL